jgi:phenylacetate-CoA ligase
MTSLISKLWWRRYLRRNATSWQELDSFAALPPDRQRERLGRRLLDQVQYFGHREDALPEWREAARIQDPAELWKIWPSLPMITKQMLHTQFEPSQMQRRFGLEGRIDATGGSTGEPTRFFHDWPMLRAITAQVTYTMIRMGWRPGMPLVSVWGSERDIGKNVPQKVKLHYQLTRQYQVDGYSLTDSTTDRVLELIRRNKPVAMYGFTSMLEFVARQVHDRGLTVAPGSVRAAWNGGEMLSEAQAEIFRSAFHVPLFNRYGGRELSTMACQYTDGGPLVLLRPWLMVDVVNEQGKPVGPGESGRLLWTSTVCRGTPFLRYEVEDWGHFRAGDETEAGITALGGIDGRSAGVWRAPSGKTINNLYWNHLFKEFSEVRQFQVIIRKEGTLCFLFRGNGWSPEKEEKFRQTYTRFLGEIPSEIRWVDEIPRTSRGKRMQVVREN